MVLSTETGFTSLQRFVQPPLCRGLVTVTRHEAAWATVVGAPAEKNDYGRMSGNLGTAHFRIYILHYHLFLSIDATSFTTGIIYLEWSLVYFLMTIMTIDHWPAFFFSFFLPLTSIFLLSTNLHHPLVTLVN